MAINNKQFLDFEGLSQYDELIKQYINEQNSLDQGGLQEVIEELASYKEANDALVAANKAAIEENAEGIADNKAAIEVLNGDGEGSVTKQVSDAIAELVNEAPEAFDTLKEIADWIASDETASAALLTRVSDAEANIAGNKADIVELKSYVDMQDKNIYDAITAIGKDAIKMLFLKAVEVEDGASVADAIENLQEGEKLVLTAATAEDLVIPANAVIDANGQTLSGNVTIAENAVVANAVFTGKVTVG